MIKANELRVGNYLEFRHPTGWSIPTRCESWMIKDVELIPNSYRPIPLTEEWLVKMEFRMHEGNNYYKYWIIGENFEKGFEVTFAPISQEIKFCFTPRKTDNRIDFVIKHVHQLQNLYFALTEEELTIK